MLIPYEQPRVILHDAVRACGLDGHISEHTGTAAEGALLRFGGNKKQPRKNSYLFLDSVDACFHIQHNKACCVFSARWYATSEDLGKLDEAGALIKEVLEEIQNKIDKLEEGERACIILEKNLMSR